MTQRSCGKRYALQRRARNLLSDAVLSSQLLEAMVERPPPRALHDGFEEIPGASPISPTASPVDQQKPAFRPYIRRSRSSSSDVLDSPKSPSVPQPFREPSS